jgi:hypothetical protein
MVRLFISTGLMMLLLVAMPLPTWALPITPQPTLAQAAALDLTTEDISNFANAYRSIQAIKQDAEADMVAAVEAQGLTVEQFNTIVDNQLNGESGSPSPVAETETAQFEAAVESIITIRQEAEVDMQSAIADEGISVERFNQIIDQASQDTDLQQQISVELNP